jgi:CHAT domain
MSCDLELEIRSGDSPGHYIITVDSPAGTASGRLRLDTGELLNRRRELASAVLASAVPTRRLSAQELPIRQVGQQLFEALFAERVYGRYTASVQEAARRGEPLRVVLRLRAPELAGLPWEAMFDPEADEYLCQREPIVRYVETAQPANPLRVKPPLRILGLVSAPGDLPTLDVEEEKRRLSHAIDDLVKRGQVDLTWAPGGTWPCLQEVLLDGDWHVLHFIGHGGVNRDTGVLALEDELTGQANLVSSARFARLLHTCRPVPRLVVLNSCQSGEAAADDLLSSTAAALVHSGISASVAMQFAVTDPAALAFSRGFYQALAHAHPVDEAVRLGRIMIDGTSENTLEWVTPVLFLRTDETRLFSIVRPEGAAAPAQPPQPSPEQAERASTLHGLYMQALAAMRTGRDSDAITLLDSLLALEPGYRDAADRRDAARRNLQLASGYERARAAENAGNWAAAVAEYTAIADPGYRDVSERLADCTRRQQIAGLHEELRNHVQASEWQAVIAVCDELAAIGAKSAEVDRAAKTARQQIRREEAASRARRERSEQHTPAAQPERPEQQSLTARPAAVAGDRARQDQPTGDTDAASPQPEPRPPGERWRIFYASHFPVLGSSLIAVPLAILVIDSLISSLIFHSNGASFRVMMIFGLAGAIGAAIDYRNGCGVSAVAIGLNSIWLLGYAVYWSGVSYVGDIPPDIQFLREVQVLRVMPIIGLIINVLLLIYAFRLFADHRFTINTSMLLFLVFMTAGFVSFVVSAWLPALSLLWLSGTFFSAALLSILAGIVLAVTRARQARPRPGRA